jgi:hypothetical protein
MNTLSKNRIIEKGDEFRHTDGRWLPVPDGNVGLQIMYSEYKEVRRPSEANITLAPPTPERMAELEREQEQADRKKRAALPAENSHLPTVVSKKAHTEPTNNRGFPLHKPPTKPYPADPEAKSPVSILGGAIINYTDLSAMPEWIGRNGTFKATGLDVQRTKNDLIQFRPIGKRGLAKNALIEIPIKDIAALLSALTREKET